MKSNMKRTVIVPLLLVAMLFAACGGPRHEVRLMSYNVRNCLGLDGKVSYDRVARVINEANPDAVAIQELDSMTSRFPDQDVLRNLAERTGMYPVYAASIDFRGGKYGIGMLTREKPLSFRRVPLPCRSEPRSLLIVELPDYYYCSTHLSLNAEDRVTDAKIIVDEFANLDKPAFLAGDFNAEPDEEAMRVLRERFEVFGKSGGNRTYPADEPEIEIDYICCYKGAGRSCEVADHKVIDAVVESDHRPITADVKF